MQYFLIKIAYDGSKFYGFQRLNDHLTVQKVLEESLTKLNKKEVIIKGAGRTDRGVHANDQGVTFSLDIPITCEGLKEVLNTMVNPYIYVKEVTFVSEFFHARFSVQKKEYVYKINLGEYEPTKADYMYQCPYKLDISKMKEASSFFIGVHDFHNFVSGEREDYQAILYSISFEQVGDVLSITFVGKSFYRYMVRHMVGALLDVGRGKIKKEQVRKMLEEKEENVSTTAPSCGLYLNKVEY